MPLKVAFSGIDRYFERYYRKGPRRRPVKIDFCDADVLDVFDEWKRATGVGMASASSADSAEIHNPQSTIRNPQSGSLPAHLERVVLRLTSARASGTLGDEFDALIDRAVGGTGRGSREGGRPSRDGAADAVGSPCGARRGGRTPGAVEPRRVHTRIARAGRRIRTGRVPRRHDRGGVRARAGRRGRSSRPRTGQAAHDRVRLSHEDRRRHPARD